jgi:hypothetical protein
VFSPAANGWRSIGDTGQINIHNQRRRNALTIPARLQAFQFVQVTME